MAAPGTLHVVATPLGYLEDLSPRAIRVLTAARIVACEDTRRTRRLLTRFGIRPPRVVSCHRFNEKARLRPLIEAIEAGEDVALVTDGGTPAVSDPGALVVAAALEAGLPVSPVPGPSAVAAAVSCSGFTAAGYLFVGFLPAKGAPRREALGRIERETLPIVLFEAPHRIDRTCADLIAALGDREVTVVREATKLHEEVRRTRLASLAEALRARGARGEYTIVLRGAGEPTSAATPLSPDDIASRYEALLAGGADPREALRAVVRESGRPRREVYALVRGGGAGARRGEGPGRRRRDPEEA